MLDRGVVALPVGGKDGVDERHLLAPAPHGDGAAQGPAGLDREGRRESERQVIMLRPALEIPDAVGDLGRRLIHQHIVVVPEDVAQVDRDIPDRRPVAFGDRPEQVQREVAVGAADLPIEIDRPSVLHGNSLTETRQKSVRRISIKVPVNRLPTSRIKPFERTRGHQRHECW